MAAKVATLLHLLAQSAQVEAAQREQAERELQELQKKPLDASFLADLLGTTVVVPNATTNIEEIDPTLRLMACLWLKNHLKMQWKLKNPSVSDQERAQLRQVLLFAALNEPQHTIALHLALILAQIARAEFPTQWPFEQLFASILQNLHESNNAYGGDATTDLPENLLREKRSVDLLYRLVKELATRRLMVHRKQFALLSVEILPLALQHWHHLASRATSGTTNANLAIERLGLLLTSTKLLSAMFLNAFRDLVTVQNGELMRTALVQFYEQLRTLVQYREAIVSTGNVSNETGEMLVLLDKCTHRLSSIVVGIQKSYAIEFREYLSPFLSLFWNVLSTSSFVPATNNEAAVPPPTRLHIEALQFFANVLSCRLYKNESLSSATTGASSTTILTKVITASGDVLLTDALVLEAQAAVDGFFSAENRFEQLLQLVVMRYMRLTSRDLEEWKSDAEAYSTLTESLTAQESVRACAENLFLTLIQNFPQQTIPPLTQMTAALSSSLVEIANGTGNSGENDNQLVLDMDAVLLAIGLGCYDLHDCFEFEPWFLTNLVPILMRPVSSPGCSYHGLPVLHYRIVWLVSCWLAQLSANIRPPLYDALLDPFAFTKQADTDAALKIRIVQTLEAMVTDWGFERDPFFPFLPRAFECLFYFFPQAEESDTKLKILTCAEAIVHACGAGIIAVCEQISAPLPSIWSDDTEASNLVRGKILQLLTKLLTAIRESQLEGDTGIATTTNAGVDKVVEMCVVVVGFATDITNPDEVFLMESGIELWNEMLQVSTGYTEELHNLFNHAIQLMARDNEHVKLIINLLNKYLRRGGSQFWQSYHSAVAEMLMNVVGSVKAEVAIQVAEVMEHVAFMFPSDQLVACNSVVKAMVESCVLYQQNDANKEPESVIVGYLSVVACLVLHHLELLLQVVLNNNRTLLVLLLDLMLVKFFSVGQASLPLYRQKVWALAMCRLMTLLDEQILEKTGQILEVCMEVIDDEIESQQKRRDAEEDDDDSRNRGAGAYRAFQSYQKQRQQAEEDNIATATIQSIDLKAYVCSTLSELAAKLGSPVFEQLLQTVDSSVLQKFQG